MILQGKNGFKENAINNNFKRKMQFYFRRLAGVNKCYQEVNTLYYFLNKFVSIQKVPHADGALGDLQKCDLALLKITENVSGTFKTIPYGFKSKIADVGENVYVLGYPLTQTMGEEVKLTNGIISAKTGFDGDVTQYQISVPIQPGNSGGPLIDYNGNVIGIICSKHKGAENVSYAVKTSQIRNLIESVSDLSIINTTNTLQGKSLKDQVKSVNKYVYIIKCGK